MRPARCPTGPAERPASARSSISLERARARLRQPRPLTPEIRPRCQLARGLTTVPPAEPPRHKIRCPPTATRNPQASDAFRPRLPVMARRVSPKGWRHPGMPRWRMPDTSWSQRRRLGISRFAVVAHCAPRETTIEPFSGMLTSPNRTPAACAAISSAARALLAISANLRTRS